MGRVREHMLVMSTSGLMYEGGAWGQYDLCNRTHPDRVGFGKFVLEALCFLRSSVFFVLIHSIDLLLPENTKGRQKCIKVKRNGETHTKSKVKQTKNMIHLPPITCIIYL